MESATTFPTQSSMPYCTRLSAPDYKCITPKLEPNFSCDQSASLLEATDGLYHWEQMRTFHVLHTTWAPLFQSYDTTVTGESALIRTMSTPSLDTAWRRTYAWTEEREFQPAALSAPVRFPSISLAMWNHCLGHNQTNWTNSADYWDHCRRYQKPPAKQAQSMPQSSTEPPQNGAQSHDTQQWEKLRTFHSSYPLWPAMVQPNPARAEGDSPLIWTTLYPPSATGWLQTYMWDGHLEHFMPWTMSTPDHATWPPLISHAMWNLRKGSNLQQERHMDTHIAIAHQSDGLPQKPKPCPPALMKTPRPSASRSNSFARAALLI